MWDAVVIWDVDTVGAVRFRVDRLPLPWARARRQGKRYFTPEAQTKMRAAIRDAFRSTGSPGFGPGFVRVRLTVVFQRPKRPNRLYPTKSDLDNHIKQIQDSLNGCAWDDDRQVVAIDADKRWTEPDESPGYIVEIDEIVTF